jgi:hypothetical protein
MTKKTGTSGLMVKLQKAPLVLDKTDYDFLGREAVIKLVTEMKFDVFVVWGMSCIDLQTLPVEPHVHGLVDSTYPATKEALLGLWRKLYSWLNIPWGQGYRSCSAAYEGLRSFGITTGSDVCQASSSGSVQRFQAA